MKGQLFEMNDIKYIFVTGGVVSGLGKGITAASLGRLLKARGLKVAAQKLDPYMNVDPGVMSPFQHGEVFVTCDGAETDLDLGHYERFIDEDLTKYCSLTSGKAYWNVLNRERAGGYLGETVQVIPHITNEIKQFIYNGAKESKCDVMITEIGGTIGDIEGQPFIEAIRQVALEAGRNNCLFIHVTLVPYISGSNEFKSKPTQHSVKELRAMGINPDIIITRSDSPLDQNIIKKISLFCNVKEDCVIENITLPCLYDAPIMLHENGLDKVVCRELNLDLPEPDLKNWMEMLDKVNAKTAKTVTIALVGKYVKLHDAYLSVAEALTHAGFGCGVKVKIKWIESESYTGDSMIEQLRDVDGILVPGGFGERGIEGKLTACRYARENNIPYLGICLGMQIAVIEYARNVCGIADADSREFNELSKNLVIDFLPGQYANMKKGGTMRLGSYPCKIVKSTFMDKYYKEPVINERHRHRYEFNNEFKDVLVNAGLKISGTSPDETIVEAVEVPGNDFFVGVQFHPEFKSRPTRPHPLFLGLVENAMKRLDK